MVRGQQWLPLLSYRIVIPAYTVVVIVHVEAVATILTRHFDCTVIHIDLTLSTNKALHTCAVECIEQILQ